MVRDSNIRKMAMRRLKMTAENLAQMTWMEPGRLVLVGKQLVGMLPDPAAEQMRDPLSQLAMESALPAVVQKWTWGAQQMS